MSILHLDYKFPKETLLTEYYNLLAGKYEIKEPNRIDQFHGFWLIFSNSITTKIAKDFIDFYNLPVDKYIVNYLLIEKNCALPWHTDMEGSMCAVNCILTPNPAPISFKDHDYHYDTALIDVKSCHSVNAMPEDRIIFRITFQDENATFNNVSKWLKL